MPIPAPIFSAGSIVFDGSVNSAIIEPHTTGFLLASGTLEFDFVANQINDRRFLFSKDSGGFDDGGHLGVYIEDGALVVRIQSTNSTIAVTGSDFISAGQQHHVAVTFGSAEGLTVYVDGVVVATNTFTGGLIQNQEPIVLGANQWASGDFVADDLIDPFEGTLTRFSLYNEALNADEVGVLFNAATGDPNNTSPIAQNDTAETDEDAAISIVVLANDSDPDGDTLTVVAADAINGAVQIEADSSLTYVPNADFNGIDTISYSIDDGRGGRTSATVDVTVNAINDAPTAADATFQISSAAATNDVLGQVPATDVDGDTLSYSIIAGNDAGVFGIDASGTIFVADRDALDPVTTPALALTVSVSDGVLSDTAAVSVNVSDNIVPAPILEASALTFSGNTASAQVLPHSDTYLIPAGTLEFDFVADAINGRRFLFSKDSGGFDDGGHAGVYIENGSIVARFQSATQTFVAQSTDLISVGSRHHVAVTFGGLDGLQIFVDGEAVATNAFTGGLGGNQEPIVIGANQWGSGDLVANNLIDAFDGDLARFALYSEVLSTDQIAGLANNGISVPGNNAPVAADDVIVVDEDTAITIGVLANDIDPDGDSLDVTQASASNGTVTINANGALEYTPDADFNGADTINYTADDRRGGTDTASVAVTVAAVNDAPVIGDATFTASTTVQNNDVIGTVSANDVDGDVLTFAIVGGNDSGAFGIDNSGNLLIVDSAALNQQATQSFALSVAVSDGQATSTGAVTVNVSDLAIPVPILASADLSFDGSTASAQILPHLNAYLLPEGTLEFDFTPDAVNGRRFLFSKDSGGFDDGGHLGVYVENGELVVRIQSTTATFVAESANLILPGESYHVAVTFGTEGLTVYLDGQEVASNAFTGGLIQNQEPIVLGANQWASGDLVANNLIDPFDGNISRFALYGEALSADQVLELAAPPPVNTAPVLDAATLALDEGQTNAGTITATDADGDALTFALTANADTDNALFAIDAATGALSFLTPPDFESAQDANGDNVYVVEVQADDGNGGIASGQFNVTVNDVGEAVLQISGAAPFDFGGINAGTNSNAVFMVNNVGDGAAASIQIGQLDFPFLIPGGTIFDADTLDAGAAASLTVQFAPDSAGNFSDDLELSYFGGVSNQFLTRELLGEGIVLNAPPVAVDDSGFGDEDTAIQGNVLANDSDPDGNPLTARLINDVSSGVLTLDADGSFNYTPESDFSGTDSFSYVVNDGSDNSAEATVTLNVEAVADVPTLTASLGAPFFEVGTPVALNIATDVTDLDGSEAITEVRVSGLPEGAMLSAGSVQADGSVVLTSDELAGLTLTVNPVPAFDVSLELSGLDGTNGFQINGIAADDQSGYSVSDAGDVNGDGIDDVIIGARFADPGGNLSAGQSYVVFGSQAGFAPELDLSSLDGTNGFQINGIDADDQSGISVSGAGDVNGDGIDDVIVGAWFADPNGLPSAGESYVVFGSGTGFDASFDLSSLDGENGIVISGRDAGDFSGFAVSGAGDFNGDGIEDIIVGAFGAEFFRPIQIGETYVVFGSDAGFGARIDLDNLNGANGFALSGIAEQDLSGASVANAGDVNGDGLDDIIIGAQRADRGSTPGTGQSYVVFGSTTGSGANLPLATLDGTNGFSLSGVNPNEFSGTTVASAGDINGDGFDDVIIGTEFGFLGGDSYVVFGSGDVFEASLNLSFLDGTNGFTINGIDGGDRSGRSVSGAGDVNGDGIDDLIVGATDADPNGNSAAGESYVVFGSTAGFGAEFDLASLDGTNGFQINGIDADDESGFSVSGAGDINGDGVDDLIIGATGAGPIGNRAAGGSYVVFGRQNLMASDFQLTIEAAATDTNPVTSSTDTTTASTTVAVSSQQPNTAPEASDDADYTIDEDNTLSIGAAAGVLGNDTDADGDPLTTTLVTGVANGTLTLNADGSFDYTPNADFSGTDSFTYVANDGAEDSAEATVTITVNPVNDAPTFEAASFAIDEGQTVAGTIMATDADGDALTFALTANADTDNTLFAIDATTGALSFLAPPDFENAQDADGDNVYVVEVQADDGNGGISSSQFNVTVNNVGEAMLVLSDADPFDFGPAAQRVTVSQTFAVTNIGDGTATNVDAETALPFAVAGGSALDADGVEPGATRALFVTFQTFSSGLFGEDLVLSYFDGVSDQVLVRGLLGEGLTLAPIAVDDIGVGDEDTDIQGNVLTNDSDPDGDPLRATLLVGPANGTVVINDSGNYTYTPEAEFNGTDSFTYTLEDLDPTTGDPLGPFDIGTVTITVNPINDAPVASPTGNTASGDENTVINGTLPVASDVDDDVSTLTYELAPTLPPLPPVVINPDGTFEVTPPADFVGDITFDYIVRDPSGAISDPQVFTVTVLDTNTNAVIAGDLTGTVTEDVDLIATGELSVADPDAGEDQVIAQIDTAGQFGKFSVSSDGAWSYTLDNTVAEVQALAAADAPLTDTFAVTSADGTAMETVSLTINGVDEPPVITEPPSGTNPTTIDEDTTAIFSGLMVELPDQPGGTINGSIATSEGSVALTQSNGLTFSDADGSDGTLAFSGTTTDITTALANSIAFTPIADFGGIATIDVAFDDGGNNGSGIAQATSTTLGVDVAAVADAPVITISAGGNDTPQPTTGPILVDADAAGNNISSTKSAVLNNGNVVVATFDQPDNATEQFDWFVNVFDSSGALIARNNIGLIASSNARFDAREPVSVAPTETGFVAVWDSELTTLQNGNNTIFAQTFSGDGTALGTPAIVVSADSLGVDQSATSTPGIALEDVDTLSNGNVLVTWSQLQEQPDNVAGTFFPRDTKATLLSPAGQAIVQTIDIENTVDASFAAKVAPTNDGGFIVTAFELDGSASVTTGVNRVRIFDSNGQQTSTFTTDVALSGTSDHAVQLGNGNVAVIAQSVLELQLTIFDQSGNEIISDVSILDQVPGSPNFISGAWLAPLDDGGFVATARIQQSGGADGIYLQRFGQDGGRVGDQLQFDSGRADASPNYDPEVHVSDSGQITVFWSEAFSGLGSQTGLSFFRNFAIAAAGQEDTPITVPVSVALGDADGSETIVAIDLSGLPAGFTATDGTNSATSDGVASISVVGWDLANLQITPALNFNGTVSLLVSATSEEASNANQATATQTADINFAAVDDAPTVALPAPGTNPTSIDEDTTAVISAITVELPQAPLNIIEGTITTGDGAVALTQSAGLTFTDGDGSDGSLAFSGTTTDITAALANSIAFTPTADLAADATISLSFTNEGDTASISIPLTVNAVADQPLVDISAAPINPTPLLIAEQQINGTTNNETSVDLAALSNGNAIAVWSRFNATEAQIIDASGTALDTPVLIVGASPTPTIAAGVSGSALIVHVEQMSQVGLLENIIVATLLDENGSIVGTNNAFVSENLIGQSFGAVLEPDVTSLANGSYVVSWTETAERVDPAGGLENGRIVRAQVVDSNGSPIGNPVPVSNFADSGDSFSASSGLANGNFVVAWDGPDAVLVRVFDSTGAPLTDSVQASFDTESPLDVQVVGLSDGGFVVGWNGNDGTSNGALVQLFDAAGNRIGDNIIANTTTVGSQSQPALTAMSDGGFLVSFNAGLAAQRFDAQGNKLGTEFALTARTATSSELTQLSDGTVLAVWQSFVDRGGGASDTDIFTSTFNLPAVGMQDTPLALPASVALTDTDGSETIIAIDLSGLPNGFEITDGSNTATSDGTTTIDLLGWSLADLVVTPATGFTGPVTVSLTATSEEASNTNRASATTTLGIDFTATNVAPNAVNDTATTDEDTPITIDVLDNDNDLDGDVLSIISLEGQPVADGGAGVVLGSGATVSLIGGEVVYDPTTSSGLQALATGESLSESFVYTIDDGNGETASADADVTISGIDEAVQLLGSYDIGDIISGNSDLDGFAINGDDPGGNAGRVVSNAGDLNGDGIDDIVLSAPRASNFANGFEGLSYVIFGGEDLGQNIELSSLSVSDGIKLLGSDLNDGSGNALASAGDVNGDGVADIIVGASQAEVGPNAGATAGQGISYVVYGKDNGFSADLPLNNLLAGTDGFWLIGEAGGDSSGASVAGVGDINNDGIDDLAIGATGAGANGSSGNGKTYIVFGSTTAFSGQFSLGSLNGSNGFVMSGLSSDDLNGFTVSGAGDANGDGIDDLIVGSVLADSSGNSNSGESYVVFGSSTNFGASFDFSTLNGSNGFRIPGLDANDIAGRVAGIGDVNGDGVDDVAIGAIGGDPDGMGNAGEVYVIFGSADALPATFDLTTLDGTNGFVVNGIDPGDETGFSVAGAGDINGDELDDFIIGSSGATPNGGAAAAGESYVVFGSDSVFAPTFNLTALNGANGFKLNGIDSIDVSGQSVSGAGDVNNDGFDDLIIGAEFGDPNGANNAGETYVVFGGNFASRSTVADLESDSFGSFDFGAVSIGGGSASMMLDITNRGSDDAEISDINLSVGNSFSVVNSGASTISPGEVLEIEIEFAPFSAGQFDDALEVEYYNGFSTITLDVDLFGMGI